MNLKYAVMLKIFKDGPASYMFNLLYNLKALTEDKTLTREETQRAAKMYVELVEALVTSPGSEIK